MFGLGNLFGILSNDIGIDLGTANTLVCTGAMLQDLSWWLSETP